ncbi:PE family protein [Mycobacterium decipiens]|uniref:PE family protein n=1 Tax=Mycobacterium decipiens TaxID=1430326 RepID=A0A1X2LW06_9MYCO|nr:PE family protein [Mycobacterium decipiens]OSC41311.1 PE family protein [Mycobacterium decipiens]
MSFLNVAPDTVTAAAGNLESIASALGEAAAAAAPPTVGLAAPAADRVSAVVAAMLGTYARDFQGISAQVAAFHDQFVGALKGGAAAYASAEAAAQQSLLNAVNAPAQALLGHPLIGPGTADYAAAAVTGGVAPLLLGGGGQLLGVPFSHPTSVDTPFGPVTMTLNGSADVITGQVVIDSGSLVAPTPLVYGVHAIGPAITTMTALQNSGAAFANAVQTGNPLAAAGAVIHAPGDAVNAFLFGQTAISQSLAAPQGSGYTSAGISVPVGGLLAPIQPVSVTLTSTDGAPTVIQLSGPQTGGIVTALLADLVPGF